MPSTPNPAGVTGPLNKSALCKLGFTPALIAALLGKPDQVEVKQRGAYRWIEHLYEGDRARQAMRDPRFRDLIEVRTTRKANAEARRKTIPKQYSTWRAALPDACSGMFALNRYAKHRACSELHRVEIYQLKNDLIELLWRHGYCLQSWIHRLEQADKLCRECGGTGEDCDRCGYSGIYRPARTLEFWCFRFSVQGKLYCWHQPRSLVKFTPQESAPPQGWEGLNGEKPVPLPKHKFAAAKELLRWVIDQAAEEELSAQAAHAAEPEIPAFGVVLRPPRPSSPPVVEQELLFPV